MDKLDPKASPNVKRVTIVPMLLVISIILAAALGIAYVMLVRMPSNTTPPKLPLASQTADSQSNANAVLGNATSGIIPAADSQTKVPIVKVNDPDAPPLPPTDPAPVPTLDPQIVQLKQQQFSQAVSAKTKVELPDLPKVNVANSMDEHSQTSPKGDKWRLMDSLANPTSSYELRSGAVIPGLMISGINSELPGQIMGQVSEDVYDTATGKYRLIPQGTRIVGTYASQVIYGQRAVLIAWQRLILPDGRALDLGSMPGTDSAGYTGFRDQVNNHYARLFGSALLMSLITGGIGYGQDVAQPQTANSNAPPTFTSTLSQALGQQLGEVTTQMISKNLSIAPTLEIRPGYRFNITVTKDLVFSAPYQPFAD